MKKSYIKPQLEVEDYIFAEYKVTVKGNSKLSLGNIHQIQRVVLLLNIYESFRKR